MKTKNSNLKSTSALGLATLILAGSGFGSAFAQSSDSEIVVTGTRIRGAAPVGSAVTTIGREDVESSGAVTTNQLLQQIPQIFNLGISETSRAQSGGSSNITNGASPNLRGIGAFSTLVMINGHRVVPQGTSGFAVDPSTMPTLSLQRVEVVADGASAIYGSDAVAGVINLVMRRNFDGLEVQGRYGSADSYDEYNYGFIAGKSWTGGNLTVAYENGTHSALQGKDRSYFGNDQRAFGGPDKRLTQCAPGTITVGGNNYAIPAGGVSTANRSALVSGTRNLCDLTIYGDIIGRQERNTVSFTFDQALNDWLSLYADGFASERKFRQRSAYQGVTVTIPSTNPYFVLPIGVTATSETVNFAYTDYPQPYVDGFSRSWNTTIGATVKLPADWRMDLNYSYGLDHDQAVAQNLFNNTAQTTAINSTNPATALNPFGSARMSDALISGILNGLNTGNGGAQLGVVGAKFDGPLGELPGGPIRMALGVEQQDFDVRQSPITGNKAAPIQVSTERYRTINSGFAEIILPLFGDANAVPFFRKLDLNIAYRYDNYSDVGVTKNPKYGVNWSPAEGIMFRGSYGTSFRAPGIAQIFGNSNTAFFVTDLFDPTVGTNVRGLLRSGPNLKLTPETATTWSVGGDFNPAPGLKLSLTYFSYDYQNQVAAFLSDRQALRFESLLTAAGMVIRNPSQAFINQQIAEASAVSGSPTPAPVVFLDGRNFNGGRSVTEGVDISATYRVATERTGDWAFGFNGTYMTKYDTEIIAGSPVLDQLNVIFSPMKFKARGSLTWTGGTVTANMFVNYINSYTNNTVTPVQSVPAYTSFDFRLAYGIGSETKPLTVAIDLRNAFDDPPPYVNTGSGFDNTQVSTVGRIVGISLNKRF